MPYTIETAARRRDLIRELLPKLEATDILQLRRELAAHGVVVSRKTLYLDLQFLNVKRKFCFLTPPPQEPIDAVR